jgi:hypothetical protein
VRLLHSVAALALVGLVLVSAASAANSLTIPDPTGDAGSGPLAPPDVTSVSVSNDDSGTLTFRISLANRTVPFTDDEVCMNLDLDQDPDTGTVEYGSEAALCYEGMDLEFFRPDSSGNWFSQDVPPESLKGTYSPGLVTFSVNASDLGLAPGGGFNFFANTWANGHVDFAPDLGTANYQLVPGTKPPALGPDTRPPVDQAFTAHGRRGKFVHLDIEAADGRGETADTFRIYRRGHLLSTRAFDLQPTQPLAYYFVQWLAPRRARGPFKFCVTSTDAAGNKSNTACAPIILR